MNLQISLGNAPVLRRGTSFWYISWITEPDRVIWSNWCPDCWNTDRLDRYPSCVRRL